MVVCRTYCNASTCRELRELSTCLLHTVFSVQSQSITSYKILVSMQFAYFGFVKYYALRFFKKFPPFESKISDLLSKINGFVDLTVPPIGTIPEPIGIIPEPRPLRMDLKLAIFSRMAADPFPKPDPETGAFSIAL